MKRLIISDPKQLCCRHGRPPFSPDEGKVCKEFLNAYLDLASLFELFDRGYFLSQAIVAVTQATARKYANVSCSRMETVISILLLTGTQCILGGDKKYAQLNAFLSFYFQDFMAVNVHKTKATIGWAKIGELESADDHTLVSYYRKHTSCSCLDEIYKEVKSLKKMGMCYNPKCSHPERMVERSKMFSCTRCGDAKYCSVECQKADWKDHKEECNDDAKEKAAFDSEQA